MSGYLLDTNVVSEARKRQRANPGVTRWLRAAEEDELFLSVLVLGEIRRGIEQARSSDAAKAKALERWLNGLEEVYADHVLPITSEIADEWGRLGAIRPLSVVDGLLAATALTHDLTLVTRNARHAGRLGIKTINPFDHR